MVKSGGSKSKSHSDKGAQERLLDTAEELFCERGYEGTSVRDIAAAAKCNIASVNYYFGSKERLYYEVWHRHLLIMLDTRLGSIEKVMSRSGGKPRLEELLRSFANAFIEPLAEEGKGPRLIKLMTREMLDRRLPPNVFVQEMIMPTLKAMQNALLKICPGLEESKVPLLVFSFIGQLIHAVRVKAMFEQDSDVEFPMFDLNEAVTHIVKFSAAGIRAYAEEDSE